MLSFVESCWLATTFFLISERGESGVDLDWISPIAGFSAMDGLDVLHCLKYARLHLVDK